MQVNLTFKIDLHQLFQIGAIRLNSVVLFSKQNMFLFHTGAIKNLTHHAAIVRLHPNIPAKAIHKYSFTYFTIYVKRKIAPRWSMGV